MQKELNKMRKITSGIITAFNSGISKRDGNTTTDGNAIYLYGSKIAEKRDGVLWVSLAGWNTNTTRERLNGLDDVSVNTKLGQAFLNGKMWDGGFVAVNNFIG